jgi:hypothetical protein
VLIAHFKQTCEGLSPIAAPLLGLNFESPLPALAHPPPNTSSLEQWPFPWKLQVHCRQQQWCQARECWV